MSDMMQKGVPHFPQVRVLPLRFYGQRVSVPVFDNQQKYKEAFAATKKAKSENCVQCWLCCKLL